MMNEFERAELAAENDGFSNDSQRAFAVSCARRDHAPNDAPALVALGFFVAVEHAPEYCRITDACMGTRTVVLGAYATREAAAAHCAASYDELGDSTFEVLPRVPAPRPLPPVASSDECPF
jgi:hypothetical protein